MTYFKIFLYFLLYFHVEAAMADVYCEMSALEMDVEDGTTPLIPGLDPPPTANPPPQPLPTPSAAPTRQSNIVNNPRRPHQNQTRRCLLHLVMRCPVCYQVPHQRNPRIFRQDGIRAIIALIRDVFGVQLNPREFHCSLQVTMPKR